MHRRSFLCGAAALAASCRIRPSLRELDFDALLLGGTLVDGTGAARRRADVALYDGRIVEIGALAGRSAALVIECEGSVIAPGFIDVHAHSNLRRHPGAESKLHQGVTLDVTGPDGGSAFPGEEGEGLRRFSDWRAQYRDTEHAIHLASYVGHGSVRRSVLGHERRAPSASELDHMRELVRQSLSDGAVGLSSGLEYSPDGFASTDEVVALAEVAAEFGAVYATHVRNEDSEVLRAAEEAIEIARRAGCPLLLTHLKAAGAPNWPQLEQIIERAEAAREAGVEVWADRYPYLAYSTGLSFFFPPWAHADGELASRAGDPAQREAMRAETEAKVEANGGWESLELVGGLEPAFAELLGTRLDAAARELGREPYSLACELIAGGSPPSFVGYGMSAENTARVLSLPWCMVASDGSAESAGARPMSHPRSFGSFPRVLRQYVREEGLLTLEQAVHKMTALPAQVMGFPDRGRVAVGAHADLVVFDPARITDHATYLEPRRYAEGVEWMFVAGELVIGRERRLPARPGRIVLRA